MLGFLQSIPDQGGFVSFIGVGLVKKMPGYLRQLMHRIGGVAAGGYSDVLKRVQSSIRPEVISL